MPARRVFAFLVLVAAGCTPPRRSEYEVGELEEERVLKAVRSITGALEKNDPVAAVGRFTSDYADPSFERGRMVARVATSDVIVADWTEGDAAPSDRDGMRAWFAAYLSQWLVVSRAQGKIRRVTVDEEAGKADGLFFFHVYGVSAAREAREDFLHAHIHLEKRGGEWAIWRFRIVSLKCAFARKAQFRNVAREAGAEFTHRMKDGWQGNLAMPEVGADAGLACGDVDGDGFYDVYLLGGGPKTLLRNRGDGTFEDATARSGLAETDADSRGAVFADFDNDGDADLFVSNSETPTKLFRNEGGGTFTDVTRASGIDFTGFGTSVTVADYDRDGLLDVYQCVYGNFHHDYPVPGEDKPRGQNLLWRNAGGLKFEEVGERTGLDDRGWSLAATWGDVNDDAWPDLLLANDFGDKRLYLNDGEGGFDEVAEDTGLVNQGFGMSAALGDIDGDGDFDAYFSNMYSNTNWIFTQHELLPLPWFLGWLRNIILGQLSEMTSGNALFTLQNGRWTNVTARADVAYGQWAWASEFVDFDADGDLDIYCVNGFLSGPDAEDL